MIPYNLPLYRYILPANMTADSSILSRNTYGQNSDRLRAFLGGGKMTDMLEQMLKTLLCIF